MKEKETLDLEDKGQKKQHSTVIKNKKAMMQLALSFTQVSLMNKLNCKKCMANQKGPLSHVCLNQRV